MLSEFLNTQFIKIHTYPFTPSTHPVLFAYLISRLDLFSSQISIVNIARIQTKY